MYTTKAIRKCVFKLFLVSSVPRASHSHNDRATASNPNRTMCTEGEKGTKEGVERTKPRVLYYYYVILNMPWAANVLCYYTLYCCY